MSTLGKISGFYHNSNLEGASRNKENFTEFNTIESQRMNALLNARDTHSQEYESEYESSIAINYDVEGAQDDSTYPNYITYVDHPVIKNKFNIEFEESDNNQDSTSNYNKNKNVNVHFDGIVNFYFASISIVGLFILFRSIQKSRF